MIQHDTERSGITLRPPTPVRIVGYLGLVLLIAAPVLANVITLPRVVEAPSFVVPAGPDYHLSSPEDGVVQWLDLEEGAPIHPGQAVGMVKFQRQDDEERRKIDVLNLALDQAIRHAQSALEEQYGLIGASRDERAREGAVQLLTGEVTDRRAELALRRAAEARARLGVERGVISADFLDERMIERVIAERELKSTERELIQVRQQIADERQLRSESVVAVATAQVELLGQLTRLKQEQVALKQAEIRYDQDEPRSVAELLVKEGDWVKRGDIVARTVMHGPSDRLVALLNPADALALAEGTRVEVELPSRDGLAWHRSVGVVIGRGSAWTNQGRLDTALAEDARVNHRVFLRLLDGKSFPVGTRARVVLRLEDTSVFRALLSGGSSAAATE
jgi:multidrug efflux pump subunit AcrA (membrane-fusion protein)